MSEEYRLLMVECCCAWKRGRLGGVRAGARLAASLKRHQRTCRKAQGHDAVATSQKLYGIRSAGESTPGVYHVSGSLTMDYEPGSRDTFPSADVLPLEA